MNVLTEMGKWCSTSAKEQSQLVFVFRCADKPRLGSDYFSISPCILVVLYNKLNKTFCLNYYTIQ